MANLSETPTYDAGVYQLETTDPVQGGAAGVSNSPLKNLANRTAYLKQRIDGIESGSTDLPGYAKLVSPAFTGSPTAPTQALGDNTTKIANTAFVQATIGGRLVKSVAGSANVTLTAVEAGNAILELTGALTGNIALIVPTSPTRSWIIKNATSGGLTITVKTAAGTGVIVTQGTNAIVWTDGTNVYDALTDFDSPAFSGTPTAPTAAPATNTTQVATTAFVTNATDGRVTVNVAGSSDVTLTATQYGAAIVDLTGVLTDNIDLVFPNVSGQWVVANNSTGAFNITAKTAAGTGVVLPSASAVILYGDGTNIYAASAAGQTSFKMQTYSPVAGTASLTVTGGYTPGNVLVEKNGALLDGSAFTATTSPTVTLTTAAVTGDTFTVYAFSSFSIVDAIQRSGDTMAGPLTGPSSTSEAAAGLIELATEAEAQAMTDEVRALTPARLASAFGGANQSLSASGYQKLPSGLIIQWGTSGVIGSGANLVITLPMTYPTAIQKVLTTFAQGADVAAGSVYIGMNRASSLSSITIRNLGPSNAQFDWLTIGY